MGSVPRLPERPVVPIGRAAVLVKVTAANRERRVPYMPIDRLPETSWDGLLQYAFLRERATWSNIPADDLRHL